MTTKKSGSFLWSISALVLLCFLVFLPLLLIGGFGIFLFWTSTAPSHVNVVFPSGTQVIEQTDTHRGFFRTEGTAIMVAQIPETHIQMFAHELRDEDFSSGPLSSVACELLSSIEGIDDTLASENILWTYRDEATAFIDEPFSDCFAAIFDLDSGLLCWVEYDS